MNECVKRESGAKGKEFRQGIKQNLINKMLIF